MTTLPRLTSTGRLPGDTSPARQRWLPSVDGAILRARLIAEGVIIEHTQSLPPVPLPEGVNVVRMTEADHRAAAAHIAQGRLGSRRVRDDYEGSDRREARYGGRR